MKANFAILVDGGFIRVKLKQRNKHFPTVAEINAEIDRIKANPALADYALLRVYYYDAPPASGVLTNPVDSAPVDLAANPNFAANLGLQQKVEMQPDFALRSGETSVHGCALGDAALRSIVEKGPRVLEARDFVPNIEQKGVDLRIGLDIARLALRGLAQVIVVVTGDSDMVPAFKFARREGVRVYLDHMGHAVKRDLKAHVDLVL
ncbi:MAG: NYN domain-containing protein [Parvibaculum sp.]|nr:NYN domain-containing protein [Parvibaculum sp.]